MIGDLALVFTVVTVMAAVLINSCLRAGDTPDEDEDEPTIGDL